MGEKVILNIKAFADGHKPLIQPRSMLERTLEVISICAEYRGER